MNDICPFVFCLCLFFCLFVFFKFTYLIRTKEVHTEALICRCKSVTADVSESLKKQCAMTSFSCHILLDQSAIIFQNSFFSLCELLIKFVNCS